MLQYDMFLEKYQSQTNTWHGHELTTTLPFCRRDVHMQSELLIKSLSGYTLMKTSPDLDKSGWKIYGEKIEYDWVKGNLIVPEELINILCE